MLNLWVPLLSAWSKHFSEIENSHQDPKTSLQKSPVLTMQRNRRGQCYHRLSQGPVALRNCILSWVTLLTFLPSQSESQCQLLVSFHLLSLQPGNKVSNEVTPSVYHPAVSRQAWWESEHFRPGCQEIQAQLYVYISYCFAFYRTDGEKIHLYWPYEKKHFIFKMLSGCLSVSVG